MKIKLKYLIFTILLGLICLTNCGQVSEDFNTGEELTSKIQFDENLEIFLCIGQSNMAGRADIMEEDRNVLQNAYLFNSSSEWEKAQNPMNKYSTIRKDLDQQKLSPSWTFAEILEANGKKVGLVVNARGGSSMKEWARGGVFYTEALNRVIEAKKTGVIKAIIWHQGESNQNSTSTYTELFIDMIEGFREDLFIEDLPVIVGEIGKWRESATKINNVLVDLKNHISNLDYVSGIGITHLGDDTHFNSESQRVLGRRYAAKYLELSNNNVNTQLPVLEDTYTNGLEPDSVEGTENSAIVKSHPDGWERMAYLKFDLTTLPEGITSAKLFFNAKTTSEGDFEVEVQHIADDSWNEDTATFNNFMPVDGAVISEFSPSGVSFATPYMIDISAIVAAEQKTNNIISLGFKILTQNNSNDFRIVTKENETGEYAAAYLDVSYLKK